MYYASQHHHQQHALHASHPHHSGRSRRAARASASHSHHNNNNSQHKQQMRALRLQKEAEESAIEKAYRRDIEAARSFDLEDDELFCPFHLLTEDDLQSIHSASSDRSSLSSGSPEQSPLQQQLQPTSQFLLPPSSGNFTPQAFQQQNVPASQPTKIHQPLAQRKGNAIPIVDPTTRNVASPPPSVSPARQMQFMNSRRW